MNEGLIYSKMTEIIKLVGSVSKDKTSVGKFTFKYRGIDDVMNALHDAFGTVGVFISQDVLSHAMTQIEGRGIHHLAKIKFGFYTTDGSHIDSTVVGECIENGDKGLGKCMSYALKTCLLQTFLIPTEDDSKDPDSVNQPVVKAVEKKAPPQDISVFIGDAVKYIQSLGEKWEKNTGKPAQYYVDAISAVKDIKTYDRYVDKLETIIASWDAKPGVTV